MTATAEVIEHRAGHVTKKGGPRTRRSSLAKYGHGRRAVRVFVEAGYVRVMWRERKERRYQSWPDTRLYRQEAKAFAQGLSDTLGRPKETPTLTLRELWDRYRDTEFAHLRPNSQRLYMGRWNPLRPVTTPRRFLARSSVRSLTP